MALCAYYLLLALIPWRAPMQKHGHASCGCWRPRPSRGCVCSAGAFHRAPSVYAHLGLTGSSAPPRYSVADVRISRRSKLAHGPFQHEFNRNPLSFLRRGCRRFGSCASWCTPGIRIDRRAPLTPSGMILNGVSVSFFQGKADLALLTPRWADFICSAVPCSLPAYLHLSPSLCCGILRMLEPGWRHPGEKDVAASRL